MNILFWQPPGPEETVKALDDTATLRLKIKRLSLSTHKELTLEFGQCQGGKNIVEAGLQRDIEFAAWIDRFDVVVEITGDPPVARKMHE